MEDAKAGLRTVAMILGKEGSLQYHKALVGGAYATVLVLMCLCGTPLRQAYVTLCVPWALYLTRRFDAGAFTELPQAVAQHNLLFGVILTAALSEPLFVARVLLACLYYLGGFNNILCWEYVCCYTPSPHPRQHAPSYKLERGISSAPPRVGSPKGYLP